jgi:hypothetical protein
MSVNKYVATNAATFVNAVANTANSNIDYTTISIEQTAGAPGVGGDVLELASTLVIPDDFTGLLTKTLIIDGNGVTIRPNTAAGFGTDQPLIKRNSPTDNKSCSIIFKNINFDCRYADMICVQLFNASNVVFENCRFNNAKKGLMLANVNGAFIRDCSAKDITLIGFETTVDPAVANSFTRCNNVTYQNCVMTPLATAATGAIGFKSLYAQNIAYYECRTPVEMLYGIYCDSGASAGVPNVINNLQIRNFSAFGSVNPTALLTGAVVYMRLATGFAKIDGLYITGTGGNSTPGMVVVEANAHTATGSPNPHLYVENLPWIPNSGIFKTEGGIPAGVNCPVTALADVVTWEFKEVYDGRNIFNASRWYGGLIPRHRYAEFFDESKIILTDSLYLNNKYL